MKSNSILIQHFIKDIWNENRFDLLADYIHDAFIDHSLPGHLLPNAEGLTTWVLATGKAFRHRSVTEEQVTEGDRSMIKFRMDLEHIGVWRDIKPQGAQYP
ncbi:ester cyclase [Mucilaginibacter sp. 21P]|uniref:ester cyclase n=1 Tax=Mucilaginibacter sp. 21P TaxID=2778902 RepID=UPI001C573085|nr:ester cyclase [Mucilaginibacter sp. 21P]QXV63765.1 ester cyclase [Mucilaginibacter sp. 21P]